MSVLMLLFMLILLAAGVPVAFSLGLVSALYFVATDHNLISLPQRMVAGINSFPLTAIPFFMLAGELANAGGVSQRIFRFAAALVGHIRGGLSHTNILGSMIFAGMSGSAVADLVGLGVIELHAMREAGYDDETSVGVTVASATLGPIIPPSINMVIYGSIAAVSVGALFLGGVVPGVLLGLTMMALVAWTARRKNYPVYRRASLREVWDAFRGAFWPLMTPAIILGGVVFGAATPTEAGVIAVIYTLVLGTLVYREISWRDLYPLLLRTVKVTAGVMLIIAAASPFGYVLARERIPQLLAEFLLSQSTNPNVIWLLLLVLLLIVGCFMEVAAALVVLTPVLAPVAQAYGMDPVHFGVVVVFAMCIGLVTPPIGMSLYVGSEISGLPIDRVVRGTLPFIVPMLVTLLLITYWPELVVALPNALLGK